MNNSIKNIICVRALAWNWMLFFFCLLSVSYSIWTLSHSRFPHSLGGTFALLLTLLLNFIFAGFLIDIITFAYFLFYINMRSFFPFIFVRLFKWKNYTNLLLWEWFNGEHDGVWKTDARHTKFSIIKYTEWTCTSSFLEYEFRWGRWVYVCLCWERKENGKKKSKNVMV